MCEECFYTVCPPACPNAPEPAAVCACDICFEPIRAGEAYIETPHGGKICDECIDDLTVSDVLEYLGCVKRTAVMAA